MWFKFRTVLLLAIVVVLKGFELLGELLADVVELWPPRVTSPLGRLDVVATRVVFLWHRYS